MESSSTSSASASLKAPAKVNLFLKVLNKRPDGYHELETLMQPVSLYDRVDISIGPGDAITVSSTGGQAPSGPENVAHKAAALLLSRMGLKRAVDIRIEKRIPVGAGLGGGSSDAATVIIGLNRLLNLGLDKGELMDIGAAIGSDVPFFFVGGPAVARGRGEILRPVRVPACNYILMNPGYMVSTAWAYENLDLTTVNKDNILTYSDESLGEIGKLKGLLSNDLEGPTMGRHPDIGDLKKSLVEAGALAALMSGSGPTVFGLFDSASSRDAALARLTKRPVSGRFMAAVDGLVD